LADQAAVYLRDKGKSESTVSKYVWIWKQIDRYLHDHHIMECNKEAVTEYVRKKFGDRRICDLSHYEKSCVSLAFNLIQFMEVGEMFEMIEHVQKEKAELHGAIGDVMLEFLLLMKSRRLSKKTLKNYKWYLYKFQNYLYRDDIIEVQRISPMSILSYCSNMPQGCPGAKHAALCLLRSFLRYAYDEKKTNTDLSLIVPRDNYKNQPKLPSTYTKEEVDKILATADRSTITGKRNYAILLLIVRLGLRASDIRALQFDNIKWAMNTIAFEKQKTGELVELPLPADTGEAIIDYLKYGRPVTEDRHIFVEHNYPYPMLKEQAVSLIADHAIRHSGIDIGYRKHGSHALRHTMAGFLLEGKTPVPLISAILGHKNVQSTMYYLRIDLENLRQCALDVPVVNSCFYEQKDRAFYTLKD
jgi:site-specific recombinase XerD